jgi:hypothetical protein
MWNHRPAMKESLDAIILAAFTYSFAVMEMMTVGTGVMNKTVQELIETVAQGSSSESYFHQPKLYCMLVKEAVYFIHFNHLTNLLHINIL